MIKPSDGATPLDYDEITGLIPTHITTKGELDALEFENIARALPWMKTIKAEKVLTADFICRLHKKMFCDVWKWAGKFRRTNKNIGIHHKDVPVEVHKLCLEAEDWLEFQSYIPEEFAVRFHHRLVFIHPFSNGNGRHARVMADLIMEKLFNREPFSWGRHDLAKQGDVRTRYISALKKADDCDYSALIKFASS